MACRIVVLHLDPQADFGSDLCGNCLFFIHPTSTAPYTHTDTRQKNSKHWNNYTCIIHNYVTRCVLLHVALYVQGGCKHGCTIHYEIDFEFDGSALKYFIVTVHHIVVKGHRENTAVFQLYQDIYM